MKLKTLLLLILILFLTNGCAATWSYSGIDRPEGASQVSYEPTKAENITITALDITDKKYKVIGDITATVNKTTVFHADPTRELVNKKLTEEAAALGADAVVLVRYGKSGMGLLTWGSMEGKGRAVKYISD